MAFVSFRNVRGLMVFLPFLKFMIALLATPDRRESSLLASLLPGFDPDISGPPLYIVAGEFRYIGNEASTRWAGGVDLSMMPEARALDLAELW